jgi:hypothetical protein
MTRHRLHDKAKQKRLAKAGWRISDAKEFLELSDVEAQLIEIKIAVAKAASTG